MDSNLLRVNQSIIISKNLENTYHEVKKGDSIWNIAKKYNVNVEELKVKNNLNDNKIYLDDMLIIPKKLVN